MSPAAAEALEPQGPAAESIAGLWWLMFVLGLAVFLIVAGILVVALFRRRPTGAPRSDGPTPRRLAALIVGGGVVLPVVVVGAVFAATVGAMRDVSSEVPDDALVVEIIGHQWWWEVRYPDEGVVTANEVHMPVGRPVAFRLRSADVIHSVWVPALGGKMDVLPDRVNTLVLEADVPGTHHTECAEFCGLQHAQMELVVVAESTVAFDAWLNEQQQPAGPPRGELAERGAQLFAERGCAHCHRVAGTAADGATGPDLTHLASRPEIGAGAAENTATDLADWITDPHAAKAGVAMPVTDLTDGEVRALIAHLEQLE